MRDYAATEFTHSREVRATCVRCCSRIIAAGLTLYSLAQRLRDNTARKETEEERQSETFVAAINDIYNFDMCVRYIFVYINLQNDRAMF